MALGDGAPAAPTGVTGVVPAGLRESWAAKKNPVSWLLRHGKCVCAVAGGGGGVLETFSGHNSPWKGLLEVGQLHTDPGTWGWLQRLPVGTGVAIPRLFLCVWALVPEICRLVLFNSLSSLGEKGLGLRQSCSFLLSGQGAN